MADSEEPSGTSHLFGRLSSKEEDLFGTISNEGSDPFKIEPEKIEEEDLIAQMDAIEIETSQAISPEDNSEKLENQKIPEISPNLQIEHQTTSENLLDENIKNEIASFWIQDEKLDRIFKLREENHTISNNDFDLICQPRLATFTSFQGQNDGTDLRELIKTQLAKKDYLEAFNLAGNVINSEAKSKDQFCVDKTLDVWFGRFVAILRLIETSGENYAQLAETEAAQFGTFNHANFCHKFFPSRFPRKTGSLVPFGLRIIVLQILIKCGSQHKTHVGSHVTNLLRLKSSTENILNIPNGSSKPGYLDSSRALEFWRQLWSERLEAVERAIVSALRLFSGPRSASQYALQLKTEKPIQRAQNCFSAIQIYLQSGLIQEARETFVLLEGAFNQSNKEPPICSLIQNAKALIYGFQNSWKKSEENLMALVSSGNADWQTQNNLGVALFHQEKIQQASAVYEAELTKHLTNCGVITPNAIFPVQRNLMTLNEMYKK